MGGFVYICTGQCSTGQIVLMVGSILGSVLLTLCCYLLRAKEESEDRKGLVGHMEEGAWTRPVARRQQRFPNVAPHVVRSEAEKARLASLGGYVPPSRAWTEAPAPTTYALPITPGLPTGAVAGTHSSNARDSSSRLTINFPRTQSNVRENKNKADTENGSLIVNESCQHSY